MCIVRIQKSSYKRIVITGLEIVQACFFIINITAIAERIQFADCECAVVFGEHIAPRIVGILCDCFAVFVNDFGNITLQVFDIVIHSTVAGNRHYFAQIIVVEEQRIVALSECKKIITAVVVIVSFHSVNRLLCSHTV